MFKFTEKELHKLTGFVWMPLEDTRCVPMQPQSLDTENSSSVCKI